MIILKMMGLGIVWAIVTAVISLLTRWLSCKDKKRGYFIGGSCFFIATVAVYFPLQGLFLNGGDATKLRAGAALLFTSITWGSIGANLFVKIFDNPGQGDSACCSGDKEVL